MLKLLRNLLKSPMFVIGISIFVLTLLIALFGPLFYSVDTHARLNTCSAPTTLVVTMCPC